jgi:hypothetical protein
VEFLRKNYPHPLASSHLESGKGEGAIMETAISCKAVQPIKKFL